LPSYLFAGSHGVKAYTSLVATLLDRQALPVTSNV